MIILYLYLISCFCFLAYLFQNRDEVIIGISSRHRMKHNKDLSENELTIILFISMILSPIFWIQYLINKK